MDSNSKKVDPNGFTKEVEEAIDDLFSPTKAIEIDPVTNEVREVEVAPGGVQEEAFEVHWDLGLDEVFESSGEEGGPSEKEEGLVVEPEVDSTEAETEGAAAVSEEPGGLELDMEDLELELDMEDEQGVEATASTDGPSTLVDLEQRFNQLYEAVLALEWEVTSENIEALRQALEGIREAFASVASGRGERLAEIFERVLEILSSSTERLHPSVPKLLQRGLEVTLEMQKGAPLSDSLELDGVLEELEDVLAQEKSSEPQPVGEAVQVLAETEAAKSIQEGDEHSAALVQAVRVHLEVLDECIQKLRSLEDILLQTKGLEKLLRFNAWIHARLEGERTALQDALEGREYNPERISEIVNSTLSFVESAIQLSEVKEEASRLEETRESKSTQQPPPFSQLFVAELAGEATGFLPDEVCLSMPVSGKLLKSIQGLSQFPLAKLKKWPWSKLSSLVKGELANMGESALRSLSLPMVAREVSGDWDEFINPVLVILYRDDKGGVVVVEGMPQLKKVGNESLWSPSTESGNWIGRLTTQEGEIRVFSIKGS